MKNYRIFVEKRPGFRVEAESLQHDLNENLGLHLSQLRLLNVYDLFGFTPELLEASRYRVFGEVQTDEVTDASKGGNSWRWSICRDSSISALRRPSTACG